MKKNNILDKNEKDIEEISIKIKCSKIVKQFFLGKDTSLPKKPWSAIDVVKMVILTGIILLIFGTGGIGIARNCLNTHKNQGNLF